MTYCPAGADPAASFDFEIPHYPKIEKQVADLSAYLSAEERNFVISKVYPFACYWHEKQECRKNGDPYISHPVGVAEILAPYKVDVATLSAALLHDVHEDHEDEVSLDDIERYFGTEIRNLADYLTKIGKASAANRRSLAAREVLSSAAYGLVSSMNAICGSKVSKSVFMGMTEEEMKANSRQAKIDDKHASLVKLIQGMTADPRVIIVKLADRLHNMRTLEGMRPDKKKRISKETLDFFVPLATRLGIWDFKTELEQLAFINADSEMCTSLDKKLEEVRSERSSKLEETLEGIRGILEKEGIEAKVFLGTKTTYSVSRKMNRETKTVDQIFDLNPIFVIVADRSTGYNARQAIDKKYRELKGRFRDYMAYHKCNGYSAIHFTIFGSRSQPVEVQICTEDGYSGNRLGILNVFLSGRYQIESDGKGKDKAFEAFKPWLDSLKHIKEDSNDDKDFLDILRQDELSTTITCSTPDNKQVELPLGSVPLDFAFRIHTELGLSCIGAIVNDKQVSFLDYELSDDDVVQIIAQDTPCPNRDWPSHCCTRLARNSISRWLLDNKPYQENRNFGSRVVCMEFIRQGAAGAQNNIVIMKELARSLKCKNIDELYIMTGCRKISEAELAAALSKYREQHPDRFLALSFDNVKRDVSLAVRVEGAEEGDQVHVCSDCSPSCSDSVEATKYSEHFYYLHRCSCHHVAEAKAAGRPLFKVEWITDSVPMLLTQQNEIKIRAMVRYGLSNDIIKVFDNRRVLIYEYSFVNDYLANETKINIRVGSASVAELEVLADAIKRVDSVATVECV